MAHRKKPKQAKLLKELETTPIISVACKKTGVSRATVYRWMDADGEFAEEARLAMDHGIDLINDMAESQVIKGIQEGKHGSITFWLRSNHEKYGPRSVKEKRRKSIWDRQPLQTLVRFVSAKDVCDKCGKICDIEAHWKK